MKSPRRTIALAADHAGFRYKERIKAWLESEGWRVEDFGTYSTRPVDYSLIIYPAAKAVARGTCRLGIVLGGSGNGEAIAANKVKGIRCALCWNKRSAQLARAHNNANMISIGERLTSLRDALAIVRTWLGTKFERGRHLRRIVEMRKLEGGEQKRHPV